MLKLHASYGKKIPVSGTDFSSQNYQAEVEVEIPDGLSANELRDRIHQTFELVRRSVDAEFGKGENGGGGRETPAETARFPEPPASRENTRRAEPPATAKQLKFLADLASRRKIDRAQLNGEVHRRYGVDDVERLSKRQASELLDALNENASGDNRRRAA